MVGGVTAILLGIFGLAYLVSQPQHEYDGRWFQTLFYVLLALIGAFILAFAAWHHDWGLGD